MLVKGAIGLSYMYDCPKISHVTQKAKSKTEPFQNATKQNVRTVQMFLVIHWYGPRLNIKTVFPMYGIPMLKIRRSQDRLIYKIGVPLLVRRHLYVDTPPTPTPPPCMCDNQPSFPFG